MFDRFVDFYKADIVHFGGFRFAIDDGGMNGAIGKVCAQCGLHVVDVFWQGFNVGGKVAICEI